MSRKQELIVDGSQIREKKEPSDLFLQFRKTRKVANCVNEDWAKDLMKAYNYANGYSNTDASMPRISTDYFADMVASGVSEKKAAVLTLRYLLGFFANHIQYDNLKAVVDVVEKNFKYTPKDEEK
jgi:hypothetical protein